MPRTESDLRDDDPERCGACGAATPEAPARSRSASDSPRCSSAARVSPSRPTAVRLGSRGHRTPWLHVSCTMLEAASTARCASRSHPADADGAGLFPGDLANRILRTGIAPRMSSTRPRLRCRRNSPGGCWRGALEPARRSSLLPDGEAEHRLLGPAVAGAGPGGRPARGARSSTSWASLRSDARFAGSERSGQIQCFDESGQLYSSRRAAIVSGDDDGA